MDVETYCNIDEFHLEFCQRLIDLIGKFGENKKHEIIIEIGPGPGKTTKLLASQLEHGKIFAIDVDQNMIEFAKQSQTIDSINFLLTDLSCDWNKVNENVMKLESKVSMVFSNACINLIKHKLTFVENLKRLLRAKSTAYFSVILYPDINEKLEGELKEKFGGYVEIPTFVKQMQVWVDLFEAKGFTVLYNDIQSTQSCYTVQAFRQFVHTFLDIYLKNEKRYKELQADVQKALHKITYDIWTNSHEKSINWKKYDQDKASSNNVQYIYTVGYIVVKHNK